MNFSFLVTLFHDDRLAYNKHNQFNRSSLVVDLSQHQVFTLRKILMFIQLSVTQFVAGNDRKICNAIIVILGK